MSLAQYASPYNNDDSGDTNNINANIQMTQSQNQNQNRGQNQNQGQNQNRGRGGGGGGIEKKIAPSSFRKTMKRPLAQQQKQEHQPNMETTAQPQSQSQSRVADFMSKLTSVKTMNYMQGGGGDDGSDASDLADYQPMNSNDDNDDGVVTRENFESLPSTYASQYYQQYVPFSYSQQQNEEVSSGSKDDLMQKMNHIIQMLEDQQDEKTGSVTEELILYCFLGVFVIFVVDSFVRAGKYVR
jgi:hypothetical protein